MRIIKRIVKLFVGQEIVDSFFVSLSGIRDSRFYGFVIKTQQAFGKLLPIPWYKTGWKITNKLAFADLVSIRSINSINVITLQPREDVSLRLPHSLVPDKNFLFQEFASKYNPEFCLFEMKHGYVYDDGKNIGVLASDGSLVDGVATSFFMPNGKHPIQLIARLPKVNHLVGKALFLSTAGAANNYYHWLLELMPKFLALSYAGLDPRNFDHILLNSVKHPFQREFLDIYDVPNKNIVSTSAGRSTLYSADEMCVMTHTCRTIPPRWALDMLRDKGLPRVTKSSDRKLYISRQDASRRRCHNEAAVTAFLMQYGFEVVCLGGLSVRAQIDLFSEASAIISIHGAGLSNLVFAPSSCRVCEVFSSNYAPSFYWGIATTLGLNYTYFYGSMVEGQANRQNTADVLIDIAVLRKLLQYWTII